jgi:hypothetical protein
MTTASPKESSAAVQSIRPVDVAERGPASPWQGPLGFKPFEIKTLKIQ